MKNVPTVLFYPEPLRSHSRMQRLIDDGSIIGHNDPTKPYDVHIYWHYMGHSVVPDDLTLNDPNVINRGCYDISKVKVNRIFQDMLVDPTTHHGRCVEKIDLQGRHNYHKIVQCPTEKKEGYVYQKFIHDRHGGLYCRYRVYFAGEITHVVKLYQRHPFKTILVKTHLVDKRDILTQEEEQDFLRGCKEFSLDLGEVDVMYDGKPWVIDVNNISTGQFLRNYTNMPYTKEIDDAVRKYIYDKAGKVQSVG